jgi:hypothetical protein
MIGIGDIRDGAILEEWMPRSSRGSSANIEDLHGAAWDSCTFEDSIKATFFVSPAFLSTFNTCTLRTLYLQRMSLGLAFGANHPKPGAKRTKRIKYTLVSA